MSCTDLPPPPPDGPIRAPQTSAFDCCAGTDRHEPWCDYAASVRERETADYVIALRAALAAARAELDRLTASCAALFEQNLRVIESSNHNAALGLTAEKRIGELTAEANGLHATLDAIRSELTRADDDFDGTEAECVARVIRERDALRAGAGR